MKALLRSVGLIMCLGLAGCSSIKSEIITGHVIDTRVMRNIMRQVTSCVITVDLDGTTLYGEIYGALLDKSRATLCANLKKKDPIAIVKETREGKEVRTYLETTGITLKKSL